MRIGNEGFFIYKLIHNSLFVLAPPTYEESMFNAQTLKEEGDSDYISGVNTNFSPRYPVYNFPPTYSKK